MSLCLPSPPPEPVAPKFKSRQAQIITPPSLIVGTPRVSRTVVSKCVRRPGRIRMTVPRQHSDGAIAAVIPLSPENQSPAAPLHTVLAGLRSELFPLILILCDTGTPGSESKLRHE